MNNYQKNWYDDFPTEPIGGDNPYYRCSFCKISVPQINYSLKGHDPNCQYRIQKELINSSNSKIYKIKFPKYPHEK